MTIKAIDVNAVVIPVGENRTEKTMRTFVRDGFTHYANGKVRAHMSSVAAIVWAAEVGNATLLTEALDTLNKNDAGKFRSWVKTASSFAKGEETLNWIGYRAKDDGKRKAGFFVKSGDDFKAARENVNQQQLVEGKRFYDKADKADGDDYDLAEFLEMVVNFAKRANKKAADEGVEVPAAVSAAILAAADAAKAANKAPVVEPAYAPVH